MKNTVSNSSFPNRVQSYKSKEYSQGGFRGFEKARQASKWVKVLMKAIKNGRKAKLRGLNLGNPGSGLFTGHWEINSSVQSQGKILRNSSETEGAGPWRRKKGSGPHATPGGTWPLPSSQRPKHQHSALKSLALEPPSSDRFKCQNRRQGGRKDCPLSLRQSNASKGAQSGIMGIMQGSLSLGATDPECQGQL